MKKELALIIIAILLINITIAQTAPPPPTTPPTTAIPPTTATPSAPTTNPTSVKDIKSKTDSLVEKEITIPNRIQTLAKIIFGIEGPIEFSLLIILLIIWLMTFKLIGEGVKLMPFFENGIMSWIVALVIMLLIALADGFTLSANFILGFGDLFKIFKDWSVGALTFGVIVIIIIAVFLSKLEKWAARKLKIEKGNIESTEAGISLGFIGNFKKMLGFGKSLNKP